MRRCCDIFSITSESGKGTSIVIGRSLAAGTRRESIAYDEKQPA
jgi:hypothetical protein